jgi:centlein
MDIINSEHANSINIQLLNEKIRYLQEELSNTQADKDFVWSLWRQLQSTNPDITNAIRLVLKREKEKMEKKDEKVLKILDIKDIKIEELMEIIAEKSYEMNELKEKLKKNETELQQKSDNLNYLNLNIKTFEDKVHMFEQIMCKQEENFEIDRKNFNQKINQMVNECKNYEENDFNLKNQKTFLENKLITLENQLEQCDYEINGLRDCLNSTNEELKTRNEQVTKISKKYNEVLAKNNTNIEYIKQQEQIIIQLKQIQNELHKTLKTQDEATSTQFQTLQEMYGEACKKLEENVYQQNQLRCELNEKVSLIKQFESDLINRNDSFIIHDNTNKREQFKSNNSSNEVMIKHELKQVKLQNEILKQQLIDKNVIINDLNNEKMKINVDKPTKRRSLSTGMIS